MSKISTLDYVKERLDAMDKLYRKDPAKTVPHMSPDEIALKKLEVDYWIAKFRFEIQTIVGDTVNHNEVLASENESLRNYLRKHGKELDWEVESEAPRRWKDEEDAEAEATDLFGTGGVPEADQEAQ